MYRETVGLTAMSVMPSNDEGGDISTILEPFLSPKKLCGGRWQVNGNTRDSADRPHPTEINQWICFGDRLKLSFRPQHKMKQSGKLLQMRRSL